MEESAPRGRGRPRTPGVEERVLAAALEEYAERGWAGFTMDGVARRAGVGKSTVYLRWQEKSTLLTDAVRAYSSRIEAVDTGSFRGDLTALASNLFHYYLEPAGWATLRITVEAAGSAVPLGDFTEVVASMHAEAALELVTRAVERGDAAPGPLLETLIECLYGAVTMQTLGMSGPDRVLSNEEIADRVERVVTFVLAGASG